MSKETTTPSSTIDLNNIYWLLDLPLDQLEDYLKTKN